MAALGDLETVRLRETGKLLVSGFVDDLLILLAPDEVQKIPAKSKRKGINPFTKQEQVFAAKPATVRIKTRALKKLKDAAL